MAKALVIVARNLSHPWGVDQLSAELGVSRQTVISLESGRYSPSLGLAHAIAKRFGKRIEEIFLFEEEET